MARTKANAFIEIEQNIFNHVSDQNINIVANTK